MDREQAERYAQKRFIVTKKGILKLDRLAKEITINGSTAIMGGTRTEDEKSVALRDNLQVRFQIRDQRTGSIVASGNYSLNRFERENMWAAEILQYLSEGRLITLVSRGKAFGIEEVVPGHLYIVEIVVTAPSGSAE